MQKPSIGRIVIAKCKPEKGVFPLGQPCEAAAIITQVHSDTCVNLTVFPGSHSPITYLSVCYSEAEGGNGEHLWWHWPARV